MLTAIRSWVITHQLQVSLGLVILLAAAMRLYQINELPPGLHPDEAANGLDALRVLQHHDIRPFYNANGGREGLFILIQAIPVAILGNSATALRIAPAIIGILAVIATYAWAAGWFGRRVGLLAAFLMAVSPWAVIISREGYRAGLVSLCIPLTLWLATKAVRTQRADLAALTGISFSLGFYSYTAYRVFILVPVIVITYMMLRRWQPKTIRQLITVGGLTAIITALPLIWYAIKHPVEVFARAGGVSIFNTDLTHSNPILALGRSIVKTALMFNFHGDANYRQNLGGQPELNMFVGVMLILGLLVAVTRARQLRYAAVLMVFAVMLLPEVLTAEGVPHALRAIGALPATMALAAIGIAYAIRSWNGLFPLNTVARLSGEAVIAALIILTAYQGYITYFWAWANSPQTYAAYGEDMRALATYFNTHNFIGTRYAITDGYSAQTLDYLTSGHSAYTRLGAQQVAALNQPAQVAVMRHNRDNTLRRLQTTYPNGSVTPHYSDFNGDELFVIFTIPKP